jgi:hypothetical protein
LHGGRFEERAGSKQTWWRKTSWRNMRREKGDETRKINYHQSGAMGGEKFRQRRGQVQLRQKRETVGAKEQAGEEVAKGWTVRSPSPPRLQPSHGGNASRAADLSSRMADSASLWSPKQRRGRKPSNRIAPSRLVLLFDKGRLHSTSSGQSFRALGRWKTSREAAPRDASARVMMACHPKKVQHSPKEQRTWPGHDAWGHPPTSCQVANRLNRAVGSWLPGCVARRLAASPNQRMAGH